MLSSTRFLKNKKDDQKQEDTFEELAEILEDKEETKQENTDITINIDKLYEINSDIVGWLKIEDTNINYPVMQTKDRPQFYLRKDFYKKYSQWGTPFLAENCDIKTSDNLIIYGHNINNSKMFWELEKYKKREFYEKHRFINFYGKEQFSQYEIISVFKSNVKIKAIDKTKIYTQKLKDNIITIKEKVNDINNQEDNTTNEYGANKIKGTVRTVSNKGINDFNWYGQKSVNETKKILYLQRIQ